MILRTLLHRMLMGNQGAVSYNVFVSMRISYFFFGYSLIPCFLHILKLDAADIGRLKEMWQTPEREQWVEANWYYTQAELADQVVGFEEDFFLEREIFASDTFDDNPLSSVAEKVIVKHISEIESVTEFMKRENHFIYRRCMPFSVLTLQI
jgi:hypothetical protein